MNITVEQVRDAFIKHKTDKYHLHHYEHMYAKEFQQLEPIKKLLEIGVFFGNSIAAWMDIFPEAEISGVDIALRRVTNPQALKAKLYEADAAVPTIRDIITDTFDVIIDDGSHTPMDQWISFLSFENRWTQRYIIEDVIGDVNVQFLTKLLRRKKYRYIVYNSAKIDALYQMQGRDQIIQFKAIAVLPKL